MAYHYTSNLLKGIGTSTHTSHLHYRAALKVNEAIALHKQVMADRTKNRAEKAPLLAKLQKKLETEAQRDLSAMIRNIEQRHNDLEAREAKILEGMSMADAIALANAMKGMDVGTMIAACKESRELATALAIVPSSLSGFSKEQAFDTLVATHYPDLKAENDAIAGDVRSYESLEKNVKGVVQKISFDTDWDSLDTQVNESLLEIAPEPKTMAEQVAEEIRLQLASGIKPTAE